MKRLVLLSVIITMLFSGVAEAGFSSSFWGSFLGNAAANSLYQPPPQPQSQVIVIQPPMPQMPLEQQKPSNDLSPAERLQELKKLYDAGVITEEEYNNTKQRILNEF